MIKKIIKFPAPSLREACKPISFPLSDEVKSHLNDLRDTLAATPHGIALASNQIAAEGHRVFAVRPGVQWPLVRSMSGRFLPEFVFNPEVSTYIPHEIDTLHPYDMPEHLRFVEGCLSVPELNIPNPRPYWVEMKYNDETGAEHVYIARALTARMIQHECDHLNGKLLVDILDNKSLVAIRAAAIKNRKAGR